MGCCVSTTTSSPSTSAAAASNKAVSATRHSKSSSSSVSKANASRYACESREPPLPVHSVLVEETVKEVLSETPTRKPTIRKIEDVKKKTDLERGEAMDGDDNGSEKPKPTAGINVDEQVSEASEIYSTMSESVSTTTTLTERKDIEDGEVRQRRVVNRSPGRVRNRSVPGDLRRERLTGGSPAKRPDSSSGRVKTVPGKVKGPGTGRGRGRLTTADGQRGDPVERTERRSRSPAMRSEGGGGRPGLSRSPSARRTGRNQVPVEPDVKGMARKVEGDGDRKIEGQPAPATTNESLENPHVSLECFIFL